MKVTRAPDNALGPDAQLVLACGVGVDNPVAVKFVAAAVSAPGLKFAVAGGVQYVGEYVGAVVDAGVAFYGDRGDLGLDAANIGVGVGFGRDGDDGRGSAINAG